MEEQGITKVFKDLEKFAINCQYHYMNTLKITVQDGESLKVILHAQNNHGKYVTMTLTGQSNCECFELGARNCTIHQHYETTEI
jgi:transcriptional antiterminator Rof (Rho-off)